MIPKTYFSTPLSKSAKDTEGRIRNIFQGERRRPAVIVLALVAAAALLCGSVVALRSRETEKTLDKSDVYASVEDYVDAVCAGMAVVTYHTADGEEKTANVLDTRVAFLNREGEQRQREKLDPEGTLELYSYQIETKLDAPLPDIVLAGGMYATEDGWLDMEGQGGHVLIVTRLSHGGFKALYDRPRNDDWGGLYYFEENVEEMLHDWYVRENGLELPLYAVDLLPAGENDSCPAHRADGDGWYVYIPVQGWYRADDGDTARWYSRYNTGSTLAIREASEEEMNAERPQLAPGQAERFVKDQRGRIWLVWTQYDPDKIADAAGEPAVLDAMAGSFTPDSRVESASGGADTVRFSGNGWYMDVPAMLGEGPEAQPLSHEVHNMDGGYAGGLFYVFRAGEDATLTLRKGVANTALIFDPEISEYDDGVTPDPARSVISFLDSDGNLVEEYFVDAPDGGCYTIMLMGPKYRDELWAMAKSFTLDESARVRIPGSETLRELFASLTPDDVRLTYFEGEKQKKTVEGASALPAADYLAMLAGTEWVDAYPMDEDTRADTWRVVLEAPGWRFTYYQGWSTVLVEKDGEALWLVPRYLPDAGLGEFRQYNGEGVPEAWYRDALAAETHRRAQIEAFPNDRPLTGEELSSWREMLKSVDENDEYFGGAMLVSCFFTSFYSDPRDLDLPEFLRYCPLGEPASNDYGTIVDEAERAAIMATGKYPGDFVPTHRYRVSDVNAALMQYAGITLDDLHADWRNDARLIYLPAYDAFYNFTSDFGPGMFFPRYGEMRGNLLTLWSDNAVVEIVLSGGGWYIQAHMAIYDAD